MIFTGFNEFVSSTSTPCIDGTTMATPLDAFKTALTAKQQHASELCLSHNSAG
ncbi:hypothetical protein O9992_03250 [Vibrio lentus]|nr:hypothetical protein [Vibrio lentus]